MKNSTDTIGNRTRDRPGCSAVPQPTAPPTAYHAAQSKMRNRHSLNSSRISPPFFYGVRGSLPHSQVATTGSYTKPLKSSTYTHEHFLILSGCIRTDVRTVSYLQDFGLKFCLYHFCHARYMSSPHYYPWIVPRIQH
jgi:hypothetical protein